MLQEMGWRVLCRVELGCGFYFKSTTVAAVFRTVRCVRETGRRLDTGEEATIIREELMAVWARSETKRRNQTLDIF